LHELKYKAFVFPPFTGGFFLKNDLFFTFPDQKNLKKLSDLNWQ
jgi:hypothetical protein